MGHRLHLFLFILHQVSQICIVFKSCYQIQDKWFVCLFFLFSCSSHSSHSSVQRTGRGDLCWRTQYQLLFALRSNLFHSRFIHTHTCVLTQSSANTDNSLPLDLKQTQHNTNTTARISKFDFFSVCHVIILFIFFICFHSLLLFSLLMWAVLLLFSHFTCHTHSHVFSGGDCGWILCVLISCVSGFVFAVRVRGPKWESLYASFLLSKVDFFIKFLSSKWTAETTVKMGFHCTFSFFFSLFCWSAVCQVHICFLWF